jgi:hypothetical protein
LLALYGNRLFIADELVCQENTVFHVADKIRGKAYPKLFWGACDSSGKRIDQTSGLNVHAELQKALGIKFHTHKLPDKMEMWSQAQGAFYRGEVFVDPIRCPYLVEALTNMEWKAPGVFPHDKYSHAHDALVYLILNWRLKGTKPRAPAFRTIGKKTMGIRN